MIVQLTKWGNSQGIRIPKEYLKEADIALGEELDLQVHGDGFLLQKIHRRISLEERIQKYGPLAFAPETDWGEDHGDERWENNGI